MGKYKMGKYNIEFGEKCVSHLMEIVDPVTNTSLKEMAHIIDLAKTDAGLLDLLRQLKSYYILVRATPPPSTIEYFDTLLLRMGKYGY